MIRGEKLQRISAVLRVLVILVGVLSVGAIGATLLDIAPIISPSSEAWFLSLWESDEFRSILAWVILPIYLAFFATLYWLHSLFKEFQQGLFFSSHSIRCYQWLVWIQVSVFFYDIIWPPILAVFMDIKGQVTLDISHIVLLTLLAFIAQALSLAKQIQEENQEFV